MSWDSFSAAAVYLADFDVFILPDTTVEEKKLAMLGVKSMKNLDAVRLAHLVKYDESRTGQPSLISVLEDTRHAAVTVPVDKIYGVLAMCDTPLPVDYGVLAHVVFKAVSRDILLTNALAVLLSNIDHDCETNSMPSWAVDCSRPRQTTPIMSGILRSHQMAGGLPRDQSMELAYDSLATKALLVDIIDTCSEIMQAAQLSIVDAQQDNTDLRHVIDFVERYLSASEKQIDFTTFCAVLVAGQNDTRMSASPTEYVEMLSLLCDETTCRGPSIPGQTYSVRQQKGHLTLAHLERRMPMQTYRSLKTAFEQAVLNRRLAWSRSGELILVPNYARSGDIVGIIQGCPVPYVLRDRGDGQYAFLGECYLHSVMDGTYFGAHQDEVHAIPIV